MDNLNTNLNQIAGDLTASAGLLESFSDMTGSAQKLLNSTTEFLQTVQQQTKESRQTFQETSKTFSGLDDSMDAAADSVGTALKSAENVYDQMDQVISGAFSDESADAQQIASTHLLMQLWFGWILPFSSRKICKANYRTVQKACGMPPPILAPPGVS